MVENVRPTSLPPCRAAATNGVQLREERAAGPPLYHFSEKVDKYNRISFLINTGARHVT